MLPMYSAMTQCRHLQAFQPTLMPICPQITNYSSYTTKKCQFILPLHNYMRCIHWQCIFSAPWQQVADITFCACTCVSGHIVLDTCMEVTCFFRSVHKYLVISSNFYFFLDQLGAKTISKVCPKNEKAK